MVCANCATNSADKTKPDNCMAPAVTFPRSKHNDAAAPKSSGPTRCAATFPIPAAPLKTAMPMFPGSGVTGFAIVRTVSRRRQASYLEGGDKRPTD